MSNDDEEPPPSDRRPGAAMPSPDHTHVPRTLRAEKTLAVPLKISALLLSPLSLRAIAATDAAGHPD